MEIRREKLERAKKREHSMLGEIDDVNKKLNTVEIEFRRHKTRIKSIEADIKKVEAELSATRKNLDRGRAWIKRKLRAMHKHGQSGDLILLLTTSDDLSELLRRWKYLEAVTLYERKVVEGYSENIRLFEEKGKHLRDLHAELKKEEEKIRLTEATLLEKRSDKAVLLASLRKEKSENEKMLRELQEAAGRLLDVIRRLDEKDTYEAKGFAALKGKLPWPVNGRIAIPYGSHKDPRLNTPVFRNGIYINAEDAAVKAVYSGKIVFADWFKGYGNLLIVNHGEGHHTLYANLSEIFLKVGDIIKASEVIGRVGASGMLDAPALYFEVRYKGKPLDPAQWLKRK